MEQKNGQHPLRQNAIDAAAAAICIRLTAPMAWISPAVAFSVNFPSTFTQIVNRNALQALSTAQFSTRMLAGSRTHFTYTEKLLTCRRTCPNCRDLSTIDIRQLQVGSPHQSRHSCANSSQSICEMKVIKRANIAVQPEHSGTLFVFSVNAGRIWFEFCPNAFHVIASQPSGSK